MTLKNRPSESDMVSQPAAPNQAPPPQSRRNMLHAFWRHRWWIVLNTVVGIAGACVYLLKQSPIYASSSRIYIQENAPTILGSASIDSETGIATQYEIIRCTPLLTTVAERPDVREMSFIKNSLNPVLAIKKGLQVLPGAAPDLVTIAFEAADPVEASEMVNDIVDAYVEFTGKQKKNSASEMLRLLQKEKGKLETELENQRGAENAFVRDHGVLSFNDDRGSLNLHMVATLSELFTKAKIDTRDAERRLHEAQSKSDQRDELLDIARQEMPKDERAVEINVDGKSMREREDYRLTQAVELLRNEIDNKERELARLLLDHTPEHELVKGTKSDLGLLKQQVVEAQQRVEDDRKRRLEQDREDEDLVKKLASDREHGHQKEADDALLKAYLARLNREFEYAKAKEDDIGRQYEDAKSQGIALTELAAKYSSLHNDTQRTQGLLDTLSNRVNAINVNEDTRGQVNVSILEVGRPNLTPVRPDKPRTVGIGIILGLALGCGLAFGLDFLDERFHSAEEVMAVLDIPVLGLVPNIIGGETSPVRGRKVALDPMSDVAEAYRTIRTAVYFAIRDEGAKRLLVTSPAPGDGKTTTTSNIAIAMAQAGRRVLLIDADFRKPTMHKIFDLPADVGITSIMQGEVSRERAIHATGIEGLDLLPCGPIPSNPAEILNGQAFLDLLEGLDKLYDHIIIDSPPVIPVTDARILGALCDDTILVLRAEKSTRRVSEHACESLLSVGTRILGVVVNDVPRRRDGYGYYYGYGLGYRYYQYGYGYGYGYKNNYKEPAAGADGNASAKLPGGPPNLRLKA